MLPVDPYRQFIRSRLGLDSAPAGPRPGGMPGAPMGGGTLPQESPIGPNGPMNMGGYNGPMSSPHMLHNAGMPQGPNQNTGIVPPQYNPMGGNAPFHLGFPTVSFQPYHNTYNLEQPAGQAGPGPAPVGYQPYHNTYNREMPVAPIQYRNRRNLYDEIG